MQHNPAAGTAHADDGPHFNGVAFDAFPIFDPRPIFALAEELFPGRGDRRRA